MKRTQLPPGSGRSLRMKEASGAGHPAPGHAASSWLGGLGRRVRAPARWRVSPGPGERGARLPHVSGARRSADSGRGWVPRAAPPPSWGRVLRTGCLLPGSSPALTLWLMPGACFNIPPPPSRSPFQTLRWSELLGHALAIAVLEETLAESRLTVRLHTLLLGSEHPESPGVPRAAWE